MASLRCRGDSDCNKTQIIRNFHLYIIQLWESFFHIFTYGDVVNTGRKNGFTNVCERCEYVVNLEL